MCDSSAARACHAHHLVLWLGGIVEAQTSACARECTMVYVNPESPVSKICSRVTQHAAGVTLMRHGTSQ